MLAEASGTASVWMVKHGEASLVIMIYSGKTPVSFILVVAQFYIKMLFC